MQYLQYCLFSLTQFLNPLKIYVVNTEYRTQEQFMSIMENAENGNWVDAFNEAYECGFYAGDLLNYYNDLNEVYSYNIEDIVYIAEGAQSKR